MDTKPEHSLHQRPFKRSEDHKRPCHLHGWVSEGQHYIECVTLKCHSHDMCDWRNTRRYHSLDSCVLNCCAGELPPVSARSFLIWVNKWGEKWSQDWKRRCCFHTAEEERCILGAALYKHWLEIFHSLTLHRIILH